MMVIQALLAVVAAAGIETADMAPNVAAFAEQASGWLLEGRSLPGDYRLQLLHMPPDERLQAIIFLRRSGLLTAAPWTLDELLRPEIPALEGAE